MGLEGFGIFIEGELVGLEERGREDKVLFFLWFLRFCGDISFWMDWLGVLGCLFSFLLILVLGFFSFFIGIFLNFYRVLYILGGISRIVFG